jgi:uncharacterized protein (TIGR02271 family)
MTDMTLDQLEGRPVIGADGQKIGTVADVYFDKDTRQPEWALVTTGLFGTKHSFVPITTASTGGEGLQVPYTKDQVKDAPRLDDDGELSEDDELQLSQHYGMSYSEAPSDSGLPTGGGAPQQTSPQAPRGRGPVGEDVSGPETDEAMTRSEEELRIDKIRRPSGLVRLRKSITTEQVAATVPVQREEVRIEREPITDANVGAAMSGPDLSEEEHELTLSEEEVTVDKRVVPKERVRLDKDVVTEERTVSEDVRKEQIEVDGEVEAGTTNR